MCECYTNKDFKCKARIHVRGDILEQKSNEDVIARLYAGEGRPPQKKKYRDVNKRIGDIVGRYNEDGNIIRYLHGLAHNCSL